MPAAFRKVQFRADMYIGSKTPAKNAFWSAKSLLTISVVRKTEQNCPNILASVRGDRYNSNPVRTMPDTVQDSREYTGKVS